MYPDSIASVINKLPSHNMYSRKVQAAANCKQLQTISTTMLTPSHNQNSKERQFSELNHYTSAMIQCTSQLQTFVPQQGHRKQPQNTSQRQQANRQINNQMLFSSNVLIFIISKWHQFPKRTPLTPH